MSQRRSMSTPQTSSPKFTTPNPGRSVSVVTWFLLAVATIAVLTRLFTKRAVSRRLNADDGLVIISLLFDIGAGIAVSFQAANGLGKPKSALNEAQIQIFSKSGYAVGFLHLATLCFAKLSIIVLLRLLSPSKLHQRLGMWIGIFIATWGAVSEIASAFQCGLPDAWNSFGNTCYSRTSFWRSVSVINILTDLALIFLPFYIIQGLKMRLIQKSIVLACFSSRALDIALTVVQLTYTSAFHSSDITLHLWKWTLCTQIVQCLTIITSCVPYLRPLLEGMQSGMYMSDELRRRGVTAAHRGYGSNGYNKSGGESSFSSRYTQQQSKKVLISSANISQSRRLGEFGGAAGQTMVEITSPCEVHHDSNTVLNAGSQGSHSNIVKTTTMTTSWNRDEPLHAAV